MDAGASLKQTLTNLFDAVRYSIQAREIEESAQRLQKELEDRLKTLKDKFGQVTALVSSIKDEEESVLSDLSRQVLEFATTAVEQAAGKLQKRAKEELSEQSEASATERAKAVKSLEGFLAESPLPVIERSVRVESADGAYSARARYDCEGGIQYSFALATQNSRLFGRELDGSPLGEDLKVPVKFARTLLRKNRTPGFERLDRYVLDNAEAINDKIVANFRRKEDDAEIRMVYSKTGGREFLTLEYKDNAGAVNVMNDPALIAHVDVASIQAAMNKLMSEVAELEVSKVSLTRVVSDGEEVLENLDCFGFLQNVLKVMGGKYRAVVRQLSDAPGGGGSQDGLTLEFMKERIRLLGEYSKSVTQSLGLNGRQ